MAVVSQHGSGVGNAGKDEHAMREMGEETAYRGEDERRTRSTLRPDANVSNTGTSIGYATSASVKSGTALAYRHPV